VPAPKFGSLGVSGRTACRDASAWREPDRFDPDRCWAQQWNVDPKPFVGKTSANDIIAKVKRGRETLHQIKSQTEH
jgi:hypothetical protein